MTVLKFHIKLESSIIGRQYIKITCACPTMQHFHSFVYVLRQCLSYDFFTDPLWEIHFTCDKN